MLAGEPPCLLCRDANRGRLLQTTAPIPPGPTTFAAGRFGSRRWGRGPASVAWRRGLLSAETAAGPRGPRRRRRVNESPPVCAAWKGIGGRDKPPAQPRRGGFGDPSFPLRFASVWRSGSACERRAPAAPQKSDFSPRRCLLVDALRASREHGRGSQDSGGLGGGLPSPFGFRESHERI